MHAISSYHGNRPTNKQINTATNPTSRQNRLQYTAPLSLACSVINNTEPCTGAKHSNVEKLTIRLTCLRQTWLHVKTQSCASQCCTEQPGQDVATWRRETTSSLKSHSVSSPSHVARSLSASAAWAHSTATQHFELSDMLCLSLSHCITRHFMVLTLSHHRSLQSWSTIISYTCWNTVHHVIHSSNKDTNRFNHSSYSSPKIQLDEFSSPGGNTDRSLLQLI